MLKHGPEIIWASYKDSGVSFDQGLILELEYHVVEVVEVAAKSYRGRV